MTLDTIRWRIILGLSGLLAGLVIASVVGVTSLATLRRSLATEIGRLRESSEVGNGLARIGAGLSVTLRPAQPRERRAL